MNEQLRDALLIVIEVQATIIAELHGNITSTKTATELLEKLETAKKKIE